MKTTIFIQGQEVNVDLVEYLRIEFNFAQANNVTLMLDDKNNNSLFYHYVTINEAFNIVKLIKILKQNDNNEE